MVGGTARPRFLQLDGLRGVAALLVLVCHGVVTFMWGLYTGRPENARWPFELWLSGSPLALVFDGNLPVCLFFVLSGFVLSGSFLGTRMSIIGMVVKRYVRLTIPILCFSSISLGLIVLVGAHNLAIVQETRSHGWLDTMFLQRPGLPAVLYESVWTSTITGWNAATSYDPVLWTMSIEFKGSLLVILLCVLARRAAREQQPPILLAMCVVGAVLTWQRYVALFFAGIALYAVWLMVGEARRALVLGMLPVVLVVGLFLGSVPYGERPWLVYLPLLKASALLNPPEDGFSPVALWHGIGSILIVAALVFDPRLARPLGGRLGSWLGGISFPLYLVQDPILLTVGTGIFLVARHDLRLSYSASALTAIVVYMALALLAAELARRTVERGALRWSGQAGAHADRALSSLVRGWRGQRQAAAAPGDY